MIRIRSLLAAGAIAGLAALSLAGPAMASDNANGTTIYANNASCGGANNKTQPVEGFINFHLAGTSLQAIVHLKDAEPNTTYYLYQYGGFCSYENFLGSVVTDNNGVANLNVTVTVPAGTTSVFVYGFGDSQSVESLAANVS